MRRSNSEDQGERDLRLGEFLLAIGAMTEEQGEQVLEEQKNRPDDVVAQIAIEMGLIEDAAVDRYFEHN